MSFPSICNYLLIFQLTLTGGYYYHFPVMNTVHHQGGSNYFSTLSDFAAITFVIVCLVSVVRKHVKM